MTVSQFFLTVGAGSLGSLLGLSGGQKIISPFPASLAMVRFGLVRRVNPAFGRTAGIVEALVAVALLAAPTSPWPLLAAAGLGALFIVVVSRSLFAGKSFPCACFGNRSEPISVATLVRAACVFLAAASLAIVASLGPPAPPMTASLVGLACGATLACIAAAIAVLHQTRPFQKRPIVVEAT